MYIQNLLTQKTAGEKLAIQATLVVLGTLLLSVAAHLKIPFWPVPLTTNHVMAMFLGMVYGPALGTVTVIAYFAEALLGLPVVAGGIGPAYVFGPALGFFTGYIAATAFVGFMTKRFNLNYLQTFLLLTSSFAVFIYGFGVIGLLRFMDLSKAFMVGVVPYALPNLVGCLFFTHLYHMIKPKKA